MTAVEWLVYVVQSNIAPNYIPKEIVEQAKEMEKQQQGYSEEDVIKIVEKSRETGLTAEFLLLTFKQQEQINKE